MNLTPLIIMVIPEQRSEVLPAFERTDCDTLLGGNACLGVLGCEGQVSLIAKSRRQEDLPWPSPNRYRSTCVGFYFRRWWTTSPSEFLND